MNRNITNAHEQKREKTITIHLAKRTGQPQNLRKEQKRRKWRHQGIETYIQKTGLACWKIPQKIQIFRRKIVLERENYQFCNVLRKGQRAYSKTKVSWKVLQNRFLVSDLEFHLRMGGTHIVSHNKWLYMLGSFWHNAVYDVYDLRTFDAKFCRENLRFFPQIILD